MIRKTFAVAVLMLIFLLYLSANGFAADFQDPYKAYGLKPESSTNVLMSKMIDTPPDAMQVKLHSVLYVGSKVSLPADTVTLELGKFTNFTITTDKIYSASHVSDYNPIPNRYASITSSVSLKLQKDFTIAIGTSTTTYDEYFYNSATDKYEVSDTQAGTFEGKITARLGQIEGKPAIYFRLFKFDEDHGAEIAAEIVGVKGSGPIVNNEVSTEAGETAGETSVAVSTAIVIGLIGAGAAAAGAAATGAGAGSGATAGEGRGTEEEEDKEGSTYKMYISKDFGDKIKYGGEPVFVYARMAEVTPEGEEVERIDLTEQIEIFSHDSFLTIESIVMSGSYMGATVTATGDKEMDIPSEGTISFRFNGEGGTFQNNVTFKMVGECSIELESTNLYVLAGSGGSFELHYRLVDFMREAEVTVESMQESCPVHLRIEKNNEGHSVIVATDHGEKEPFEQFFKTYHCEIIAQNEEEYARSIFDVIICHEGLLPDFLGKPHEIRGYKNETGEMEETRVAFKLGIWNDSSKELKFVMPEEITVECTDEDGIFQVIGLTYEPDSDSVSTDAVPYIFKAKLSLPALEPIKGELTATCHYGEEIYENKTDISLIPDVQEYYDQLEEEYEKCKYIITTYMAEGWREKKLEQLEKARPAFGVKDYQLFRKNCWQFAQNLIMEEKESYLKESYAADTAIAYLEIYVYIGDVAFDIALMPVGGPIAGFLIGQAKSTALELISMRIERGDLGFDELKELLIKRIEQTSGQADGIVSMPKPNEPGKLATWLACFFLYRFIWHWYWSTDENNNPVGITGALEKASYDFAGKAASGLLGNFVDEIAPNSSFAQLSQKIYKKDKDEALAKPITDLGDQGFNSLIEVLTGFLEKIKKGLFS